MKSHLTALSFFLHVVCFGQTESIDTIQSIELRYIEPGRELRIYFEHNLNANLIVDLNKYPNLRSVTIYNYSSENKSILSGFNKLKIDELGFVNGDFPAFASNNELPDDINKFYLWKNPVTSTDTLVLPKEIEKWKNLSYLSIGCCSTLSLDKVDLSKFGKLDTLILEAPIYEVNSLAKLKSLDYLGIWTDDWETGKFKFLLDSLLPDTKKEPWCFPSNEQVLLFTGKTKSIENIVKGDTLLSYNFTNKCFVPNIVIVAVEHKVNNYPLCTIYSLDNLMVSIASTNFGSTQSVTATINHPIIAGDGSKMSIGSISSDNFIFFVDHNNLRKVQVGYKQLFFEQTKVYNLITVEKAYFVNGYLFADK